MLIALPNAILRGVVGRGADDEVKIISNAIDIVNFKEFGVKIKLCFQDRAIDYYGTLYILIHVQTVHRRTKGI